MRPDGAFMPPKSRARAAIDGMSDAAFIVGIVAMFDAGADTAAMAARLGEREGVIAQALRMGLEARRIA